VSEAPARRGGVRLIGIGNRWRADDASGLVAAQRARALVPPGVDVIELEGEPVSLLDAFAGADAVVVLDAIASGAAPGTLHRVDVRADALPEPVSGSSTHTLGLGEAIELGRALDRLPERLVVVGIEGGRFEASDELSKPVAAAIETAVDAAIDELATMVREGAR
jgi:hydrogenase maturation protease